MRLSRRSIRFTLAALPALAGCAYTPGRLIAEGRQHPERAVLRLGCVDLALTVGGDAEVPRQDPVVRVWFGNRCDHPVPIDLTRLAVTADGARPLVLVDPRGEVHAAALDSRGQGHEALEFAPAPASATAPTFGPAAPSPRSICVGLTGVIDGAPPTPICFVVIGDAFAAAGGAS